MSDQHILYTYKGKPARELTDDDRARGVVEQAPPHIPGVPLRDLTADDLEGMPDHLLDTMHASDLYEATPAGTRRRSAIKRERAQAAQVEQEAPAQAAPATGAAATKE
jgi:hypothetical protein